MSAPSRRLPRPTPLQVRAWLDRHRWWPLVAAATAFLLTGVITDGALSAAGPAPARAAGGTAPKASSRPHWGATPAAAPSPTNPVRTGATTGPIRVMVAEYPLSYHPLPATTAGPSNPKSKPLVLPSAAAVAFPQTPAQLRPKAGPPARGTAPALPPGAFPTLTTGPAVTNAAVFALIQQYFPPAEWDRANRVSSCESGQRNVISAPNFDGSRDYGIFQLNSAGTLPGLLRADGYPASDFAMALDANWNVRAAARLWRQRGWQPWTCAAKLGIVAGLWSNQPGPNAG